MYQEKTLICKDCGEQFVFSVGEQEFYAEKGFQNEPARCQTCRVERKNNARKPQKMYDAVCAQCGAQTQVPFMPKEDRPIYCSDCFRAMR